MTDRIALLETVAEAAREVLSAWEETQRTTGVPLRLWGSLVELRIKVAALDAKPEDGVDK